MKEVPRAPAWVAGIVICLLLAVVALGHGALAAKPAVSGVRLGLHPGTTRVVVDLSGAPEYQVFALADPPRIVIDLTGTDLDLAEDKIPGKRGLVEGVRAGRPAPGMSRITLDLTDPSRIAKVQLLPGSDSRPYRLVVDLAKGAPPADGPMPADAPAADAPTAVAENPTAEPSSGRDVAAAAAAAEDPAPAESAPVGASDVSPEAVPEGPGTQLAALPVAPVPPEPREPQPAAASEPATAALPLPPLPPSKPQGLETPEKDAEKPLVVIDAGHGGIDPGAIGPSGLMEKEITLAVAQAVRDALVATGEYRVILTRDDDRFIRLRERFEIASAAGARLFVSLHADSHGDAATRGASVYTLSEKASDKETAALAARENESDKLVQVDPSIQDPMVGNILLDMRRWKTLQFSGAFAEDIVKQLSRDTRLLRNTHRSAGFAVLKAPDVPSILIELGYLSNPKDEKLLNSKKHRRTLAAAIVRGIEDYFRKHPQEARLNATGAGNKFPG
jgi:N-acetylmuramoyl-L-alanine amidase